LANSPDQSTQAIATIVVFLASNAITHRLAQTSAKVFCLDPSALEIAVPFFDDLDDRLE